MELLRKEKDSYAFSVKSGFGIEGLLHAIEKSLPHPSVEIDSVIPYHRGDLVHAIHGEHVNLSKMALCIDSSCARSKLI